MKLYHFIGQRSSQEYIILDTQELSDEEIVEDYGNDGYTHKVHDFGNGEWPIELPTDRQLASDQSWRAIFRDF